MSRYRQAITWGGAGGAGNPAPSADHVRRLACRSQSERHIVTACRAGGKNQARTG